MHSFVPFDDWHIHSDYPDQHLNVEHAGEQEVKATKHWETWLCYIRKATLILISLMEVDRVQLPVSRCESSVCQEKVLAMPCHSFHLQSVFYVVHHCWLLEQEVHRDHFWGVPSQPSETGQQLPAWFIGHASSCQHNEWHLLGKLGSVWKSRLYKLARV